MDLVVLRHVESSQKRGSNLCPLHWQLDSYPPYHQESPCLLSFIAIYKRKRILHMTLPQSGKNLKSFLFLASLLLSPFTLFLSLLLSFFSFSLFVWRNQAICHVKCPALWVLLIHLYDLCDVSNTFFLTPAFSVNLLELSSRF